MGNNPVGSMFAGIAACIGVTIVLLVLLYLRLLHVLVDTFLRLLVNYYLATMSFSLVVTLLFWGFLVSGEQFLVVSFQFRLDSCCVFI